MTPRLPAEPIRWTHVTARPRLVTRLLPPRRAPGDPRRVRGRVASHGNRRGGGRFRRNDRQACRSGLVVVAADSSARGSGGAGGGGAPGSGRILRPLPQATGGAGTYAPSRPR